MALVGIRQWPSNNTRSVPGVDSPSGPFVPWASFWGKDVLLRQQTRMVIPAGTAYFTPALAGLGLPRWTLYANLQQGGNHCDVWVEALDPTTDLPYWDKTDPVIPGINPFISPLSQVMTGSPVGGVTLGNDRPVRCSYGPATGNYLGYASVRFGFYADTSDVWLLDLRIAANQT